VQGEAFPDDNGNAVVQRLAHARTNDICDEKEFDADYTYRAQPQATISRDGQYVVFATNWGNCEGPNDLITDFIITTGTQGSAPPETRCGDGVIQIPNSQGQNEVCDDGDVVTETSCVYGTTNCDLCNADCSAVLSLTGESCGDAIINGPEQCDGGNNCGVSCQIISSDDNQENQPSPDSSNLNLGDANLDNQINLGDVLSIIDFVVGRITLAGIALRNANICGGSQPNVRDIIAVIEAIVNPSQGLICPGTELTNLALNVNSNTNVVQATAEGIIVCSVSPEDLNFNVVASGGGSLTLTLDETTTAGVVWSGFVGTENWVTSVSGQNIINQNYLWDANLAGFGDDEFLFRVTRGNDEASLRVRIVLTADPNGCDDVQDDANNDFTNNDGDTQTGSMNSQDENLNAPGENSLSFFVTSDTLEFPIGTPVQGGNFGGLAGADAFCDLLGNEALAEQNLQGKTWRAYLSTSTVNAKDRIGSGPWYNAKSELVANNIGTLHTTNWFASAQILNQFGDPVFNDPGFGTLHDVITGSTRDGRRFVIGSDEYNRVFDEWAGSLKEPRNIGLYCDDWTSNSPNLRTVTGHSDWVGGITDNPGVDDDYWNSDHVTGCDIARMQADQGEIRIYCFATD
jgi:hypothetical protein